MLKRNKGTVVLTTIMTALPVLLGLALWSRLPETIATHFDANGVPNGWSSRTFTVFGLPAFLVAAHLLCAFGTMMDPKRKNIQDKMYKLVLWICPVVSILVCTCVYLYALGVDVDMARIAGLMVGVMFIIVGNYLPKCRQSYTMGIKLPWTLNDEENWNATHRFGGWLWMAGGVIFLLLTFLNAMNTLWTLGLILLMVGLPTAYSYLYYRKHCKE
ncbi:MAG: SdpI family protein [Oscillibacter sp.]|nr:SdpI family protein [Oscillibacter sp.]